MPTRRSGYRRSLVRHTLTISKRSSIGATSLVPSSRDAILSASGSANMTATNAEASMTLTSVPFIAHLANDLGSFAGHVQVQLLRLRQQLQGRQPPRRANGLFEDRQYLALH